MSHASDGELHAYLDGAFQELERERAEALELHLGLCADCRARLEHARQISGRASAILSSAMPASIEVPPFEDIEAVAARPVGAQEEDRAIAAGVRGAYRTRWAPGRMAGLAWAASVALALAVGWQGRQLWTSPEESPAVAMNERLQAPSRPAVGRETGQTSNLEGEPSATYFDDAGAGEAAERALESAPGERAEAFERDAAEPPTAGAEGNLLAEGRRDVADAVGADEPSDARANELAFRARGAHRPEAPGEVAAAEQEVRAETPPGPGAFSKLEAQESSQMWLSVDVEDAEHWLGSPVLSVPDVPVEDVAISTRDGERVVRVRQRLESGLLLELVEALDPIEARDPTVAQPPRPRVLDDLRTEEAEERKAADVSKHAAFASVRRDGLLITAQALLAADSLRALLSRVR